MKFLFCCLAVGVLPALGQRDLSVAPITLYTEFQQDPPPAVLEALHDEVQSIMSPMDLRFRWRSLAGSHDSDVSVELAVVSFKGRCDSTHLSPHAERPRALGWTHISDGAILPFTDVDCDGILALVQRELLRERPRNREPLFGRAIGRVLAHELYHIFTHTVDHGRSGVGRAEYTAQELLSRRFRFEVHESDALRASKAHIDAESGGHL